MTAHPEGPVPVLLKEQPHIEGWLVTEANKFKVAEWCGGDVVASGNSIMIYRPDGLRDYVLIGDWLLKGTTGYYFPVDPDWFKKHYEVAPR